MRHLPLDRSDSELVEAAIAVLRANFEVGRHHVGAALRTANGKLYTGVHVGSRRINVCAEEIVLGTALSAGERELTAIASVIMMRAEDEPEVVSPCGVCREVLGYYAPDMTVLVLEDGEVRKTIVSDLLPGPYRNPGE